MADRSSRSASVATSIILEPVDAPAPTRRLEPGAAPDDDFDSAWKEYAQSCQAAVEAIMEATTADTGGDPLATPARRPDPAEMTALWSRLDAAFEKLAESIGRGEANLAQRRAFCRVLHEPSTLNDPLFSATAVDVGLDWRDGRTQAAAAVSRRVAAADEEVRTQVERALAESEPRIDELRAGQQSAWRAAAIARQRASALGSDAPTIAPRRAVLRIPQRWWLEQERLLDQIGLALGPGAGRPDFLRWRTEVRRQAFPEVVPRDDLDRWLATAPRDSAMAQEGPHDRLILEYLESRDAATQVLVESSIRLHMGIRDRRSDAAALLGMLDRFDAAGKAYERVERQSATQLAEALASQDPALARALQDVAARVERHGWDGWRLMASMAQGQIELRREQASEPEPPEGDEEPAP